LDCDHGGDNWRKKVEGPKEQRIPMVTLEKIEERFEIQLPEIIHETKKKHYEKEKRERITC